MYRAATRVPAGHRTQLRRMASPCDFRRCGPIGALTISNSDGVALLYLVYLGCSSLTFQPRLGDYFPSRRFNARSLGKSSRGRRA